MHIRIVLAVMTLVAGVVGCSDTSPSGPANNPTLELQDVAGTGPERISFPSPTPGIYTVVVRDDAGSVNNTPNDTTITITTNRVESAPITATVTTEGAYYYIATIEMPSGTVTACPVTGC